MSDYKSLFDQAVRQLAAIDAALGIGDDGCANPEETLEAIYELKTAQYIIDHSGFFRLERGTKAVGISDFVTDWSIGVSLSPGKVSWWSGPTFDAAASKVIDGIVHFQRGEVDK